MTNISPINNNTFLFFPMIDHSKIYCKIQPPEGCISRNGLRDHHRTFYKKGQFHSMLEKPIACKRGYHASNSFVECFLFYEREPGNKYFKVKLGSHVDIGCCKVCSNEMEIVEEISENEVLEKMQDEWENPSLKHPFLLQKISSSFPNAKNICLAKVKQDGWLLQHIPESMKDKDICLAAVGQDGYSLKYVPNDLKNKEICWAAVENWGGCPGTCSGRIKRKRHLFGCNHSKRLRSGIRSRRIKKQRGLFGRSQSLGWCSGVCS